MKHGWKLMLALPLVALAACSQENKNDAGNVVNDAENSASNAGSAVSNMASNAALSLTPTPSPQEFVDKAAKSDAFEIAAAEIAVTNAGAQGVKDFAKMMLTAHKESTAKIKAAAAASSPAVTPNATLTDDQNEKLADLKKLTGKDFDTAYIDNQTSAHDDALDLMKKYAADGESAPLKKAAGEIAPVVEKHLAAVKELDKKD